MNDFNEPLSFCRILFRKWETNHPLAIKSAILITGVKITKSHRGGSISEEWAHQLLRVTQNPALKGHRHYSLHEDPGWKR